MGVGAGAGGAERHVAGVHGTEQLEVRASSAWACSEEEDDKDSVL